MSSALLIASVVVLSAPATSLTPCLAPLRSVLPCCAALEACVMSAFAVSSRAPAESVSEP